MENLERYFIDPEEEIALLKDVDDNWNTDMTLAIEKAAIDYNCTNRQVLRMLPLDKLVDYFIYSKMKISDPQRSYIYKYEIYKRLIEQL